jgi:hypothetical protein
MVAGGKTRDGTPDGFDDARGLVPEHGGERRSEGALEAMEVAVAQPAGCGAYEHLMGGWIVDGDRSDGEAVGALDEEAGTHLHLLE